ncbi:MAG TPA: phospholipase D family protein, partial [Candidatus Polarisedimenticolia bacterium]|nr:phospholipase D family protein [Candidatus Polarisedimenticolia bacterium]
MANKTSLTTAAPSAVLLLASLALGGCASLPPLEGRTASTALTETADTSLGKAVSAAARDQEDKSGIHPVPQGKDAFAARVVLARAAERSLDVQYYIWHTDVTGFLLLEELWDAAERGVRVRMLLDDNGIDGLDQILAVFDAHPNIEVRIYNPYPNRGFKPLGYLTDFKRLNRRMHNKSFTADTQITVVGGRNVGNEYFGAGEGTLFVDLDVVAAGRVAGEVAGEFDLYWNSDSAYPADRIVGKPAPDGVASVKARFAAVRASAEAVEYIQAVRETRLVESLLARELRFDWSRVQLLYDPPGKTLRAAEKTDFLLPDLKHAIGEPRHQLDIVSPYFVPGKTGTKNLSAYPESGIQLRIVTNSLAATDVDAVHSGYAKSRKPLLRSGARLYELKPNAPRDGAPAAGHPKKSAGSSSASLHGKTLSVDRSRVFVGSFNLDQRSANLNTEMGVMIEDPQLAGAL